MIISDFHVHSEISSDSDAKFEDLIRSAVNKNIKHLCFTEHMDIDFPAVDENGNPDFVVDMDKYRSVFLEFKDKYPASYNKNTSSTINDDVTYDINDTDINLYFGIELGLKTDITGKLTKFTEENDFDFIIGSLHLVDNIDVYEPEYFEGYDEKERYRHYFEVSLENIKKFHNFDVLGHLDYISRCGQLSRSYSCLQFADIIDEILKALISNGNGIEVNTGPYKKGLDRPNPCPDIIRRYRELGGEIITVGSDAHYPEYIANHFADAEQILRTAGYDHYCIFQKRKPVFLDL